MEGVFVIIKCKKIFLLQSDIVRIVLILIIIFMNDRTNVFDIITYALVVVGALNWGLIGFFQFDLIAAIFGTLSIVTRIIYALVGVSAIYMLARTSVLFSQTSSAYDSESDMEKPREGFTHSAR